MIPRHPIVDTGPFFDFLLSRFSQEIRTPSLLNGLRYLNTDFKIKSIQWYFSVAKPITTSPHVIAEIHQHAQKQLEHKSYTEAFWKFAQIELNELGLKEQLVEL